MYRERFTCQRSLINHSVSGNNNTIKWIPESIGKGRFGDWLENVQDWGVSRNRYWGTPLNIWECECGCQHSIGSQAELQSMSPNYADVVKKDAKEMDKEANGEVELHRPFIDWLLYTSVLVILRY